MLLLSPRHENFAQLVAGGASAAQAYRETYPNASTATAATRGPELLRGHHIAIRVAKLKGIQEEIVTEQFKVEREDMLRWLQEVIVTSVGEVDADHVLAQKVTKTRLVRGKGEDAEEWEVQRVEMPGKMEAAEKIIKMAGWYAAEVWRIEGLDWIMELMGNIRSGSPVAATAG